MKTKKRIPRWLSNLLIGVLIYLAVLFISWLITCCLIKLITLCFGWTFSVIWATGIWLTMYLLKIVFSRCSTSKK